MKRKELSIWIVLLFIILIVILLYINFNSDKQIDEGLCNVDNDCVPKEACHPKTCVLRGQEDISEGIFCTAFCEPGTLDCNQGYCACVKGECEAVME